MSKVAVIGLDGGTWDLMMPLAEEGFLPNLQRLMQEGCWGELESTLPPVTAPAWSSFATGRNPGKTGVFDFLVPQNSLAKLSPVTSRDIAGRTFYEIIDEYGLSTVMINLPLSYPPRTKNPTITCMLTQGDQFIFPPGLKEQIPDLAEYRIAPDFNLRAQRLFEEYAQDIRNLEQVRFRCAQRLFQTEWDFFFLLFSGTDWIQHDLYGQMVSHDLPKKHAAFQLLRDIDHYIAWFVGHLPQDTYLLVTSDHGFQCYRGAFLLNQWLREQKLLKARLVKIPVRTYSHLVEKGMVEAVARQSSERSRIANALSSIRVLAAEEMEHVRSGHFREMAQELNPLRLGKRAAIDYSKTLAACTSPQLSGIYFNSAAKFQDGIVADHDLNAIKEQIMSGLRQLRDPITGRKAFAAVLDNNEAYSGDKSHLGPDIVISADNWLVVPYVAPTSRTTLFRQEPINSHAKQGMFVSCGPGVARNHRLQGARIEDMAPTILYLMGLPSPDDTDGRVMFELAKKPLPSRGAPERPLRIHEQRRIAERVDRLRESGSI